MIELITDIVDNAAEEQLARLNRQFDELIKNFSEINSKSIKIESNVSGVKSIKELKQSIEDVNIVTKEREKLEKNIDRTQAQIMLGVTGYGKALQGLRAEKQKLNAVTKLEEQNAKAAKGSYEQLDTELSLMIRKYKELSQAEREAASGQAMIRHIQGLHVELSALDATMGKHNRNVGNYTNQTFQMTQVLRELPAFAYSAQTGILGISNNLPLLADGFRSVKAQVGSTVGALGIFARSLFTFPNIFALVIGAVTIFLPKIAEAASNMKLFSSEASRAKKMQKEFSEMTKEAAKSAAEETGKLKTLKSAIEDSNVPMEKRINAVLKLKSEFPQYFEDLKQEDILNGKVGDAYKLAAAGILAKARAQAASAKITSLQNTILENELKLQESRNKYLNDYNNATEEYVTRRGIGGDIITEKRTQEQVRMTLKIQQDARELNWRNAIKAAEEEQEFYINKVNENSEFEVSTAEKTKNKIKDINKDIGPVQLPILGDSDPEKEAQNLANRYRNVFKEFIDKFVQDPENKKAAKEAMDKLLLGGELSEGEARSLKADLMIAVTVNQKDKEKAKKDLEKFLKEIETIQAISQKFAQEASDIGGIIFDKEMMRLDEKKRALEDYYNLEATKIKANFNTIEERDRALARLELEKQKRQEQIRREELASRQRQARFEKEVNVASIISNTALAIIKFLADPGGPKGLALSIGAGITGSIQLAKALAVPIPQYAKGVKSKPTDGPAIVGEKGVELVKEPGKDPYLTPDTSTLTYLKKGTEVIPHDKLLNYVYQNPKAQKFTSSSTGQDSLSLFETNEKLDKLIDVTKRKNTSVTVHTDSKYYGYLKSNIR